MGLRRDDCPYALDPDPSPPLLVPRSYAARMRRGAWHDPLLLQVIPRAQERIERHGFGDDPVGDREAHVAPALLHKYESRALLLATCACALHCRYCFRRGYGWTEPGRWCAAGKQTWQYVAAHKGVEELVLSGGDPFMLPATHLQRLLRPAARIPHLRTLRFHTRVPVAAPGRVSGAQVKVLAALRGRFSVVVVVHANCAEELSEDVLRALGRLRRVGALLLNQSVLLKGVNDTVDRQEQLCRRLLRCGVLPYYLHQLDRAAGTWHFEVDEASGRRLVATLRERLPGYLVPRYVREVKGACAKAPLE